MAPSDVVREMFAGYQAADFDALAGLIHPDAVPVARQAVAAWREADATSDRAR